MERVGVEAVRSADSEAVDSVEMLLKMLFSIDLNLSFAGRPEGADSPSLVSLLRLVGNWIAVMGRGIHCILLKSGLLIEFNGVGSDCSPVPSFVAVAPFSFSV